MHEMALTRSVVEIVLDEAAAKGASEVRAVHLSIGDMRDIVEDMFEGLFAYLARGTVAERAELHIARIPVTARCDRCGYVFHLDVRDESSHSCPSCREKRFRLNSGKEFRIERIDVVCPGEGCEDAV